MNERQKESFIIILRIRRQLTLIITEPIKFSWMKAIVVTSQVTDSDSSLNFLIDLTWLDIST